MKASPFKIANDQIPIISLIEQNNFTNESLHIIGQQLDHIEEKIDEKTHVSKIEKPLIDLPSQREKVNFKTSQAKTLDIVEKMLSDLKVKTEGISTNIARTISRNEKEIVSEENKNSDLLSFVSANKVFDDDLPEIKRFFGNSKPMSFTKNWYSKPIPPDMQFEERSFQTQFFVFANRIYEWNIDGLFEQEIINKMAYMSMVGITYVNNHNLGHPEIVDLLVTGFSGTLRRWWDSYHTEDFRESIKHVVKKDDESFPIFYESIGKGIPNGVNTLIYTILKHFVGTPSNISSGISDYLNNLRCPTMFVYRWYQDVFISRVLLWKDCYKPYWKEKFIDGLPPIFAHKVKQELMGKNDSIDYDNLTYGDILSTI